MLPLASDVSALVPRKALRKAVPLWVRQMSQDPFDHATRTRVKFRSKARSHGGFDDDEPTVQAMLSRVCGRNVTTSLTFERSASSLRDRRVEIG